jgi:hypothetical protein
MVVSFRFMFHVMLTLMVASSSCLTMANESGNPPEGTRGAQLSSGGGSSPAPSDTLGFGPALPNDFSLSGVSVKVSPSTNMPGWFPSAQQTITELFTLFDLGRQRFVELNDRSYEEHIRLGLTEEEAKLASYQDIRRIMDRGEIAFKQGHLGTVSFTNIDNSPVAEIDHEKSRTRFLFIDATLVSKKSQHLRKYVARQNSEKKRHVVLFWLNDQSQPVEVNSWRYAQLNSISGAVKRFRQYFYSFYSRPTKDNVAFGLVCGLINAGIVGVGVSALKIAFDPSADFLWTPVVVGGLWSTILGVYSQTYRGWIYNGINRYKETIKTISNTAIFNVTLLYAVDLESGSPSGITIEDPKGTLFRDSIEASPEQGMSNSALLLKAGLSTWIHGWSKVEVQQLYRIFQKARADMEKVRIFKVPFTSIEFYENRRNINFQMLGMVTQIPRIGDIVGISMMGVPVGTIFFYTYGFAVKGLVQRFARSRYPEEEKALQLRKKWRPVSVPFYFGFGRAVWDFMQSKIGQSSGLEGELRPDSSLYSRIVSHIDSEAARARLDSRLRLFKHYYVHVPLRFFQTSGNKMHEAARDLSHLWAEWRTGATHAALQAKRSERTEVSKFLDDLESSFNLSTQRQCKAIFVP